MLCGQSLYYIYLIHVFLFIPQFDYVPDASMIQRRGTSAMPLVSFNTATFHGVHKTLEMKQCLDHSGQPTFITNSSYCVKGRFIFISSCPSCLANGKHGTEIHATYLMKKPKTMLPKYVSNELLFTVFIKH